MQSDFAATDHGATVVGAGDDVAGADDASVATVTVTVTAADPLDRVVEAVVATFRAVQGGAAVVRTDVPHDVRRTAAVLDMIRAAAPTEPT